MYVARALLKAVPPGAGKTEEESCRLESAQTQRRIERCAWMVAWVGLVAGQLHACRRS